jgi:putative oxidoreductase
MSVPLVLDRLRQRLLHAAARLTWFPPLLARVTVGGVFMQTGWGKLHDLGKVTAFFTELHIPAPAFNATLVATTEFVGGLFLLVGLLSRLAALPLLFSMVIAILTAKRDGIDGIASVLGFEEFTYIVLFTWIAIAGPGPISLDRLLGGWFKRPKTVAPVRRLADTARAS